MAIFPLSSMSSGFVERSDGPAGHASGLMDALTTPVSPRLPTRIALTKADLDPAKQRILEKRTRLLLDSINTQRNDPNFHKVSDNLKMAAYSMIVGYNRYGSRDANNKLLPDVTTFMRLPRSKQDAVLDRISPHPALDNQAQIALQDLADSIR